MLFCYVLVGQADGCSPLYTACEHDHIAVVRALMGAGAAVNQTEVRAHGLSSVEACVRVRAHVHVGRSCSGQVVLLLLLLLLFLLGFL
jgi:hypothetical protein